jgi:hypothetical protein
MKQSSPIVFRYEDATSCFLLDRWPVQHPYLPSCFFDLGFMEDQFFPTHSTLSFVRERSILTMKLDAFHRLCEGGEADSHQFTIIAL